MTEQEIINNRFETKIAIQDEKFNMFMNEMRDRDNQRHSEMTKIRTLIDSINKYIFIQTVAIFLGNTIIFFALLLK